MNKILVFLLAIFPLSIFAQPTFSEFELYHYLNLGKEYYSQQRYDASIREFNELIEKDPLYAEAYQYRANAYFHTRRYREAIRDYDEAIALSDQFDNRFSSNQRVDLREVGIMEPETDIRYKLEYAMLFYNRGASKYHLSRYDEALDDFELALSINPDLETAQFSREKASERIRTSSSSRYTPPVSDRWDSRPFTVDKGGQASSPNNRYSDNWPNNNSNSNSNRRNVYDTQDRYVPTNTNSSSRYNNSRRYNNNDDGRYQKNSLKVSSNSSAYKPNTNSSRYKSNSTYNRRDTKTNSNSYANNRYNNDRYKASVVDGRNTNYSTNSSSKPEVGSARYPKKRTTVSDWFTNKNDKKRSRRNSSNDRYANNDRKPTSSRKARRPLISSKNKKKTYQNPAISGQTAQYVRISSIVREENSTMIHFSITNYENEVMRLFLERPNTDGSFFLIDAENQREYRMIRAYGLNLRPYETELKVGETMSFSIEFERIDDRVKRLHILEGVDESDTRWNFYDVRLQ